MLVTQRRESRKLSLTTLTDVLRSVAEDAPSGNVTVVFTDIESSTDLHEKCPEAMMQALKIHNSLLRELIKLCGGYEVKTVGDAFIVAFQ